MEHGCYFLVSISLTHPWYHISFSVVSGRCICIELSFFNVLLVQDLSTCNVEKNLIVFPVLYCIFCLYLTSMS